MTISRESFSSSVIRGGAPAQVVLPAVLPPPQNLGIDGRRPAAGLVAARALFPAAVPVEAAPPSPVVEGIPVPPQNLVRRAAARILFPILGAEEAVPPSPVAP